MNLHNYSKTIDYERMDYMLQTELNLAPLRRYL